ncbi:Uncharacterised protein [Moraxella lacunata]|uniref:Lipoprotein n=2 Tax=Moraxella TaxID=475 RepID=A0A378QT26_9GAMM|nr:MULTISPECIES: hypothetical protein [Moraxella]OPH37468.1 hypothetical protein B5J93_08125 [Moraxella equi]STZ00728.1 Uncharacterised protein [Moraxella lacunata]STZ03602.1 Uncharacterised protein [Moraxella equi]
MFYKSIYVLLFFIALIGCKNIKQTNQIDYCKSELNTFVKQVFNDTDTNVNIYSELSDGDFDMQSIRVYMKDNSQEGNDVTIGWLKIDKNKNNIYNITDNENVILNDFNEKIVKDFIDGCIN